MKSKFVVFLLFLSLTVVLKGQSIFTLDLQHKNQLYLKGGIHPNLGTRLGYARNVTAFKTQLSLYGELNKALFRPFKDNAEIRLGGVAPLLHHHKFRLINEGFATGGVLKTTHFHSTRFTIGDELDYGYYGAKWRINLSVQYQWIFLSKIQPTEYYRDTFYPEAKESWYRGNGGFFLLGLETAWLIGKRLDLVFWFKYPSSQGGNSLMGSPAHAALEIGWRF